VRQGQDPLLQLWSNAPIGALMFLLGRPYHEHS
jgi:hypothetical protein